MLVLLLTAGAAYVVSQWLRARSARTGPVWESPEPEPGFRPSEAPAPYHRPAPDPTPTTGAVPSAAPPVATAEPVAPKAPATPARPLDTGAPELEGASWVEPVDGECPPSHPVKAKLASGIYHVPGGLSYARTRPDRCYRDAEAAEADGLRAARR